jgi:tetratricopeptide (TPR) repeat protein
MMTSTNLSYAPIFSMVSLVEQCYASAYRALEEDDLVAAHRLFGVMAAMAPRDERAWIGLAIIRERKEQWRAAAGLYGVATAFVPTSAWCHFGKGRCLSRMGRLPDAETSYGIAEALSDDPSLLGALERERSVS